MLSSQVWGWSEEGVEDKHVEALNLNLSDRRLRLALDLARQLMGAPRHLSQHPGGFVLTHDRLDDLVPIEPAAMVDRQVIEWDKDDIDALQVHEGRCPGAGHADLHEEGLRLPGRAQGHQSRSRDDPGRRSAHLRDDPQGRHARHLPDREPGADVDAAAHQAPDLLRPGGRGGDRPAGPDPGRHGASLSAPARGPGARGLSRSPSWSRCSARRWACRSFRSRPCGSPSNAPASRPARPTSSARAWRPSSSPAASPPSATSSSPAWSPTATSRNSPSRPSSSSRASAATDFRKATPPLLR